MAPERLERIREIVKSSSDQADAIMDGGDNYDGADGAREVQSLCAICKELMEALAQDQK